MKKDEIVTQLSRYVSSSSSKRCNQPTNQTYYYCYYYYIQSKGVVMLAKKMCASCFLSKEELNATLLLLFSIFSLCYAKAAFCQQYSSQILFYPLLSCSQNPAKRSGIACWALSDVYTCMYLSPQEP
jgi:hypothetical protein